MEETQTKTLSKSSNTKDKLTFSKTFSPSHQTNSQNQIQNKLQFIKNKITQDIKTINNLNNNDNNNTIYNLSRSLYTDNNYITLSQPKFQELVSLLSPSPNVRAKSLEPAIKNLCRFTKKGSIIHQLSKSKHKSQSNNNNNNNNDSNGMLLYQSLQTLNSNNNNLKRSVNDDLFMDTFSNKKLPKNKLTLSQLEELDNNNNNNNPQEYISLTKSKTLFNRDYYKKELKSLSIRLFGDNNTNTNYKYKSKYKRHNRNLNI